jgi:hypothetical protein
MMLSYFWNFMLDIVIAWALFFLLAPVNRAVSALASLFQLVYAAMVLTATLNLAVVYRMVVNPSYLASFGRPQLLAQIDLLIHSFRYDYGLALIVFAIHLVLVGALIVRASYAPAWLGIILIVDGIGWVIIELQPYLYLNVNVSAVFFTSLGELVFMVWLIVTGLRRRELIPSPALSSEA